MNLGFDIDGVLIDVQSFMFEQGCRYFKTTIKNPNGEDISQIFNVSQEIEDEFWHKHIHAYATSTPPRRHISKVLRQLHKDHSIYIITNRAHNLSYCDISTKQMQHYVQEWLKKHKIVYDKIIFTQGDKLQACLDHNIDIFVEDGPRYIKKIALYLPTICFDANFNKTCSGKNIHHCQSVYDMYYLIIDLQNQLLQSRK